MRGIICAFWLNLFVLRWEAWRGGVIVHSKDPGPTIKDLGAVVKSYSLHGRDHQGEHNLIVEATNSDAKVLETRSLQVIKTTTPELS